MALIWIGLFYVFAAGWVWPESKAFWYGHWSKEGLIQAGRMVWCIALLFALTRLFMAVTMPLEQGLGIAYFFNPIIKITPKAADFALLITLTLRFIPLIFEEATMIWKARILKADWENISRFQKSKDIVFLIIPLILLSLKRAEELAENMLARGYGSGGYQTIVFHERTSKDSLGLWVVVVWGAVLILLR
jgi:energy-coupling factor transport system permease protein